VGDSPTDPAVVGTGTPLIYIGIARRSARQLPDTTSKMVKNTSMT
jgi:hypothetical protein